jgi:hypothetical protein
MANPFNFVPRFTPYSFPSGASINALAEASSGTNALADASVGSVAYDDGSGGVSLGTIGELESPQNTLSVGAMPVSHAKEASVIGAILGSVLPGVSSLASASNRASERQAAAEHLGKYGLPDGFLDPIAARDFSGIM